jgi:3-oxoacyl-[acyl-carrier protein] reductase
MGSTQPLEGRVALVTGSSRGIGRAAARALAFEGAAVVLHGRSAQEQLDRQAAELATETGRDVLAIAADLADPAAIGPCLQRIFARFKRLDILVNNAGVMQDALLGMISQELVLKNFAVNTFAPLHLIQQSARLMARSGGGSVVNITSIIGTRGFAGQAVYSASKAALIGLTLSAAKELAPKKIRVNAVAPGLIRTDLLRDVPEEKLREREASIGLGRAGTPEDVAGAIVFLASDASAYITGQVLGVDGGMQL